MSKQRNKDYRQRIDQALATPKLQKALHQFGDAYLLAREKAFSGHDFEAMRQEIAVMKDQVRNNLDQYLDEFIRNAEAAGATIYRAATAEDAANMRVISTKWSVLFIMGQLYDKACFLASLKIS